LTTQLLANLGAEVIQVEALSRPDVWRGGYPPHNRGQYPNGEPGARPYDRNALFNAVNTSKLGITLDLNSEEGKGLFLDLIASSDLLAENYSARVIPNFGLEYPTLRQTNPTIIMMRMPSFGASGPYAMYPGNGGTTEPMSGISSLLGYPDGQPMNSGAMHTDSISGMMGFAALLIAIRHRARTGEGQYIDLSQQETATTYITDQVLEYTIKGRIPPRLGNRDDRMSPHGFYQCRGEDSWIAIAVRSDSEWVRLCEVMGRSELTSDSRYSTTENRLQHADELDSVVQNWTLERNAAETAELLQKQNIPASPVLKALEVPKHPQHKARKFFEIVDHPATGPYPIAGVPFRLSETPGRIRMPAPTLGQHSELVMTQHLGVSDTEYADLVSQGITGDDPGDD
jgi:crotonobetainyl-CoA:carnitine CoA-transferase CaiB-like acyl-CoA transferase